MAASTDVLKHTSLFDCHLHAGAKMVPFAGWEMPIEYDGIKAEHLAVRSEVGMFDVSHMGQVEVVGLDAEAFLQRALSNDVSKITGEIGPDGDWIGGGQYSLICRQDGGVLDDVFAYRLGSDRFLVVTNAANHGKDLSWMREHSAELEVELSDRIDDFAMVAVQGPAARALVGTLTDRELPGRFKTRVCEVAGVPDVLVCGTGYTGEDGVELLIPAAEGPKVWGALLEGGAKPVGLGARDTLRMEVCFHLYGNDLTEDRGPIEAGLGWACKEETGFIGSAAVQQARQNGTAERLVAFAVVSSGIARAGNEVVGGGVVTSGTFSPSLGIGIGMAYLPTDQATPGTRFEVDVRGRIRTAEVRKKPLFSKESH